MQRTLYVTFLLLAAITASGQILWVGGGRCADLHYLFMAPTGDVYSLSTSQGIMKSTNKGNTWFAVNNGVGVSYLNRITWTMHGLFAVAGGHIFRSTNNGDSWTDLPMFNKHNVVREALDHSLLLATSSGIKRSIDSGNTWMPVGENVIHRWVEDIAVASDGKIYAIGENLYRSTDNGITWDSLWYANNGVYYRIAIDPENRIYLGGHGLLRTADEGNTWEELQFAEMTNPPAVMSIDFHYGMIFISSAKTLLSAEGPGMFYTSDDGVSWKPCLDFANQGMAGVISDSAGYLYAGSMTSGNIYKTTKPVLSVSNDDPQVTENSAFILHLHDPNVSAMLGTNTLTDITGRTYDLQAHTTITPGVYFLHKQKAIQKLLILP